MDDINSQNFQDLKPGFILKLETPFPIILNL